jgi:hypothetical protein
MTVGLRVFLRQTTTTNDFVRPTVANAELIERFVPPPQVSLLARQTSRTLPQVQLPPRDLNFVNTKAHKNRASSAVIGGCDIAAFGIRLPSDKKTGLPK